MKKIKKFKSAFTVFTLLLIATIGVLGLTTGPSMNQSAHATTLQCPIVNYMDSGKIYNEVRNISKETLTMASYEAFEDAFPNVVIDPIPDQIYNGEEPNPKVVVKDGDKILVEGEDYVASMYCTIDDGSFHAYKVVVIGKKDYLGMKKSTEFYSFIPGLQNIHLSLDGVTDQKFASEKEWEEFVKNNLKLNFYDMSHELPITGWQIKKCYVDTTYGFAYGVVEVGIVAFSSDAANYTIVKRFYLPQYIGTKDYFFPIIMSCSILIVVFFSAAIYYTVTAIREKNTKKG